MPDNYPPGMSFGSSYWTELFRCKNGHEWPVKMFSELGGGFLEKDDEAFCEECNEEGEQTGRYLENDWEE